MCTDMESRLPAMPSGAGSSSLVGRWWARTGSHARAVAYIAFNVSSASAIVFANKAVFAVHNFQFTYALTLLHTLVTVLGMTAAAAAGAFPAKSVAAAKVAPVAVSFVAYIVLCNLNLQMNSVSFYQISKIAVAPTVLAIEALSQRRLPSAPVAASIAVVCIGIGLATVSELEGSRGFQGALVGIGAVSTTALYQVWVGMKQKQLGVGSMQLLHASSPMSLLLLASVVCWREPLLQPPSSPEPGSTAPQHSLTTYPYTAGSVATILLSAVLGLAVSLSTFLVIGATSSLTYNVVGHVKSVIIIAGGVLLFDESLAPKKVAGLVLAMVGIVGYSYIKIREGTLVNKQQQPQVAKSK